MFCAFCTNGLDKESSLSLNTRVEPTQIGSNISRHVAVLNGCTVASWFSQQATSFCVQTSCEICGSSIHSCGERFSTTRVSLFRNGDNTEMSPWAWSSRVPIFALSSSVDDKFWRFKVGVCMSVDSSLCIFCVQLKKMWEFFAVLISRRYLAVWFHWINSW